VGDERDSGTGSPGPSRIGGSRGGDTGRLAPRAARVGGLRGGKSSERRRAKLASDAGRPRFNDGGRTNNNESPTSVAAVGDASAAGCVAATTGGAALP